MKTSAGLSLPSTVQMTAGGKPGKQNPRFPPFPPPLDILTDSHIHPVPTLVFILTNKNKGWVVPTFAGTVGPIQLTLAHPQSRLNPFPILATEEVAAFLAE